MASAAPQKIIGLTAPQKTIALSFARFRVLIAGRRFGKTYFAKRELCKFASKKDKSRVYYFGPTHEQAKDLMWEELKEKLERQCWLKKIDEKMVRVTLINNSTITISGLLKYQSKRGRGWDFVVLDEFADIHPNAWTKVVRPALSDKSRLGHALFIGTPDGRNWAYDLYMDGQSKAKNKANWESWQFTTEQGGNVDIEEIEAAREDLDQLTFEQEYLASFVNFEGQAYYPFNREEHVGRVTYNPDKDLAICFDFNVSPGVAVICQEQMLPSKKRGTGIVGEVHIQKNSNTPAVCRRIINEWGQHPGDVICYGDASGAARGTAKVEGSDWDLIEELLTPVFGQRLALDVPEANPKVRSRINAMNSRLKTASGNIRMMIDPKCKNLITDFESVRLEKDSNDIDKKYDRRFTHMTDALGYYIVKEFPVSGQSVIFSQGNFRG